MQPSQLFRQRLFTQPFLLIETAGFEVLQEPPRVYTFGDGKVTMSINR